MVAWKFYDDKYGDHVLNSSTGTFCLPVPMPPRPLSGYQIVRRTELLFFSHSSSALPHDAMLSQSAALERYYAKINADTAEKAASSPLLPMRMNKPELGYGFSPNTTPRLYFYLFFSSDRKKKWRMRRMEKLRRMRSVPLPPSRTAPQIKTSFLAPCRRFTALSFCSRGGVG